MAESSIIRPVSAHLEHQLRSALRGKLRVWLDARGDYTRFADTLAEADTSFPVILWRTSYIETLLALQDVSTGPDERSALLHIPHHNKDSILKTPLLEFYKAGKLFEKNLHTLVEEAASGLVAPSDIQSFLSGEDVTLELADAWLEEHAVIAQGGVDARLAKMSPELLIDLLYNPDQELLGALDAGAMQIEHIWGHLHRTFGLDRAWRDFAHQEPSGLDAAKSMTSHCQAIGFTVICWCLSVEYVHDLKRDPFVEELAPLTKLPRPLIETAREVSQKLREHRASLYESVVDEFEPRLDLERTEGDARELGKIDTFKFEQRRIMEAALAALGEGDFASVQDWARARSGERSFWVRRDPTRDAAWRLVAHAADLGASLTSSPRPLNGAMSLPEAVDRYVEQGAPIDRAHRVLEQRRSSLLDTRLPLYSELRIQLDGLRRRYRKWADQLAIDFNQLCLDHGFLPTESLQQRNVFDQEIREHALSLTPNADPPVAFFMVDALRFEMAQELLEDLKEEKGAELKLRPRLAELPTITAVGMNALAPVTQGGLLHPLLKDGSFGGFRAREFHVVRPADRQRAMRHSVNGRTCPELTLREVLNDDVTRLLKRIAEASLVIVKSRELDEGGEKGLGRVTFETTLRDLRAAVQLLRDAGIEHFVFSADHGFLLLDQTAAREAIAHGGKQTGVDRRHLVYPANAVEDGRVTVSLSALGYADQEGYLVLPEDTSIFDRGARNQLFVHGGNSLQERVIPVLHARFTRRAGANLARYQLHVGEAEGVMGLHALTLRVEQNNEQGTLLFGGASHVDVALRPTSLEVEEAPRVEVELADVRGAELRGGVIRAPVGEEVEVFFKLTSDGDVPKLDVEVYAPTRRRAEVEPARSKTRFSVTRTGTAKRPPEAIPLTPSPSPKSASEVSEVENKSTGKSREATVPEVPEVPTVGVGGAPSELVEYGGWDDLPRDGTQQIFEHIAQYGVITEAEVRTKLGSGRQFRRFSRKIDEYISHVSFDVRVEMAGGTKRYVREDP